MSHSDYDPKEIDQLLRDSIHFVHARVEQLHYGLYDNLTDEEKKQFTGELKKSTDSLYSFINDSIVQRANELNEFSRIISGMNDALQRAYQNLKQNQDFKDFLFNMIVHDMKNPLVAILGYLDSVKTSDHKAEILDSMMNYIYNSAIVLQTMILDLMDISRIEDNRFTPEPSKFIPGELFDEVIRIFELHSLTKNIQVKTDNSVTGDVCFDRNLLFRVILNILSNSFKYAPTGGEIRLSFHRRENLLELVIGNSGPVIPADIQQKLFDKFFTYQGSTRFSKGTGLGLTFCKMAIEACSGTIEIISPFIENNGAGFKIVFPEAILSDD